MGKGMMKKIFSSKFSVLFIIFVTVSLITVIAGDLIFKEGNLEAGDLDISGNITAQNYCNSTGTCKNLNQWGGSLGAQYQFINNNFNGSGNFTTKGNVNANTFNGTTATISGTATVLTLQGSYVQSSLGFGVKDSLSANYMYIAHSITALSSNRILTINLGNNARQLDILGTTNTINGSYTPTSTPTFAGLNLGSTFSISIDANSNFITNKTGGSGIAWFSNNVSAAGFMTRTSVYDKSKGSALSKIKDANEYLNDKGEIIHNKFYGYTTYEVTDYSKPIIEKSCANETDDKGIEKEVCKDAATYPYTKPEEAVNLVEENALLHQAIYELKECIINSEDMGELKICTGK